MLDLFQRAGKFGQVDVFGLDLVTLADQQRKMNDVLELSRVAGPAIGFQRFLRGLADQLDRQVQTLAVDADEILGQRQDVAGLLAQRRQVELAFAQVMV